MAGKVTDAMAYMAINAMCVNSIGMTPREAAEAADEWFREHDRQISESAWEEGHRQGESDRKVPLYRTSNPYRKPSRPPES
ncbi:hypothetical protein [Bifidobacterium callitrichidarum]|uniref:Uncharacterized protein n=1 Tax=Bifidobacterium callitrichidarum TaxID=2052941 RepID=A0A2U2NBV8_9BIFI|nr:hypothetical protein [Bifidobacterium callitrichidarum]PWG66631.1 hypothetical protein DF196_01645 [Bifidobacterium callitrichidarum]